MATPAQAAIVCSQSGDDIECVTDITGDWTSDYPGSDPDYVIRETSPGDVWGTPFTGTTGALTYPDGCLERNETVGLKIYYDFVDPGDRAALTGEDPDDTVDCTYTPPPEAGPVEIDSLLSPALFPLWAFLGMAWFIYRFL